MISYERLWRVALIGNGNSGVDIVPQAGVPVGNVMTYGAAGGQLRIGNSLCADYGPVRVRQHFRELTKSTPTR
jgi:lipid A 3-O-deacylase